jgi:hypothetical protein
MLNSKEIAAFLIVTLVIGASISLFRGTQVLLYTLLSVFLVLLINVVAKKIASFYVDSEIEIKPWEIKQYGFRKSAYFKKPFQAGIFFPIIVSLFSLGNLLWMASLVFEVKPKVYRAAKRHGLYSFSEMTESHIILLDSLNLQGLMCILPHLISSPYQTWMETKYSSEALYYGASLQP